MTAAEPPAAFTSPGYWRRLAAFTYEGVLLFGVVMIPAYLYSSLTQQRHALQGQAGLQVFLFLVLGIYFVVFWSRSGQTLALKTWHIRLVTLDGKPVSQSRALARYLLSWAWFVPSLATAHYAGLNSKGAISALVLAGVLGYAALALTNRRRQYWHDLACGTMLVDWPPRPGSGAALPQ